MTERQRITRALWIMIALSGVIIIAILVYSIIGGIRQYYALQQPVETVSRAELQTRAVVQQESGDLTGAERSLLAIVENDTRPDDIKQLALVRYRIGKYEYAIQSYEMLIQENVDVAFAYNGIGNSYRDWAEQRQDKREFFLSEAERAYEQAIRTDAGYVAAYSNLAIMLSGEGKNEKALQVINNGVSATNSPILRELAEKL